MHVELKPFEALSLWHGIVLDSVKSKTPDLTPRQMAIMLTVYLAPPPHTVRGLAKQLGVTKPAITRALDTLSQMGFLKRRRDDEDKRNVLVSRTVKGSVFLSEFADMITTHTADL